MFSVLPASLISSTYTDRNSPFARLTNSHSQFGTFSQPYLIELSRTAFPILVKPKDDHTGFVQEERLDLPCGTMILAICVFGRRIQMSEHSDLGIFNNLGASSIFT